MGIPGSIIAHRDLKSSCQSSKVLYHVDLSVLLSMRPLMTAKNCAQCWLSGQSCVLVLCFAPSSTTTPLLNGCNGFPASPEAG